MSHLRVSKQTHFITSWTYFRDVRDKDVQYIASPILMANSTFPWYILFLQMRFWRPRNGGITIPPLTEEMLLKACPEAKGSSPTTGLLIVRLVT
jgi:hypothetical protein